MKEIEIVTPPAVDPEQERIVDLHTVFNILNVVVGELTVIGLLDAEIEARLESCQVELLAIETGLRNEVDQLPWLERLQALQSSIDSVFFEMQSAHLNEADRATLEVSRANLKGIFEVLDVRVDEMRARLARPGAWVLLPIKKLRQNFQQVFAAIEKNAKGRYWFRYNPARQRPSDYYVDLKFESASGDTIWMPSRLQDVLRDLAANSRKYTPPGGRVQLAVFQDEHEISAVVEDSGRGIPADELARVVEFGFRASNVQDIRTMGGGFGLTKACRLVLSLGGRFWIASEPGHGTRVRFSIPVREAPPA